MPSNSSSSSTSAPIEKLSRPMAFDKMELLVKEMQDAENGVPVRSQKIFLTSIPSAFMGYDLIEWLMERLNVEESEALNLANQLCQHGYFFPVSDSKTLVVKDDSSLYRFQTPYYWPWRQQKAPDQIEYAIYLAKRSLRNKQRHGLEEYETEALASLHKNLKAKWDFITMQAEEQIKLAKDRKKGDKIVSDSQERAYWRVHRPPPGLFTPLESCPIPSRDRQGKPRKRTVEDWQREVEITKTSMGRNRVKMSAACESLVAYFETFSEYDPLMLPALPSNPWVTEDITFWQLNSPVVEVPTEKRVKRWAISIEELVKDPTGLQEFTFYLRKEYSHENIRFWSAVNDMRRSSHSQLSRKAMEIYEEFLEPGAPCEINIDGKTMEKVQHGLKSPSRFTFDVAAEHVYTLLLKKDCYPRFVRSEHYKNLLAIAIQPSQKKRFFGFGGPAKKKPSTTTAPNTSLLSQMPGSSGSTSLARRRGSDRSLTGSAHELAILGVNKDPTKVPHSHSQSNLSELPYREPTSKSGHLETTFESTASAASCSVCPWDTPENDPPSVSVTLPTQQQKQPTPPSHTLLPPPSPSKPKLTVDLPFTSNAPLLQSSSDIINSEVSDRMRRSCGLRQNTLDSDFHSTKRLAPIMSEQRRASMTMAPRISDIQFNSTTLGATSTNESSASELSLVINKTDSIEEEREEMSLKVLSSESLSGSVIRHRKTFSCDDIVIEEEPLIEASERKESFDLVGETIMIPQQYHQLSSLPATISTQTIPTEEFPEASIVMAINQLMTNEPNESNNEELNLMEQDEGGEEECKIKKKYSQSDDEADKSHSIGGESCPMSKPSNEQHKQMLQQQQSISQEDDYEVAMVSGLLPGCVAPACTPAPSIAPLAEIEADPTEEDLECFESYESVEKKPDSERKKKKREKKDKKDSETGTSSFTPEPDSTRNIVCPWEDEIDVTSAVEAEAAPFVKTYSTLGFL
ncbi:unnamed protein product [Diamesa serratosioi]